MKKIIYFILLCFSTMIISSCGDNNNNDSSIPYIQFNLYLDMGSGHVDDDLNKGYTAINIYLNSAADKQAYENLLTTKSMISVQSIPRSGGDANDSRKTGYAGILVANIGENIETINAPLCAFDLSCPNEARPDIRVFPVGDLKMKCQQCGSVFNLLESGKRISGPADETAMLRRYKITKGSGESKYRVVN